MKDKDFINPDENEEKLDQDLDRVAREKLSTRDYKHFVKIRKDHRNPIWAILNERLKGHS